MGPRREALILWLSHAMSSVTQDVSVRMVSVRSSGRELVKKDVIHRNIDRLLSRSFLDNCFLPERGEVQVCVCCYWNVLCAELCSLKIMLN